jgi:hypothetical protein
MPEYIVSDAYDGKDRRLYPFVCSVCSKVAYAPSHRLKDRKTCSNECYAISRTLRKSVTCRMCQKEFEKTPSKMATSRSGLHFCSRACKDQAQRLEGIKEIQPDHYGKGSYNSAYLIRIRGHRCQKCAKTTWLGQPIPLEVHHIDGNRSHHADSNLQLLCRNCHALTPNFGYKNRKPLF